MIVYGSRESVESTAAIRARLSDLAVRADLDATVEALILAGELEAGVVDAWTGDTDDDDPRFEVLRALSVGFARRMVAVWDGRTPPPVRMDRLFTQPLPEWIRVTVPEGYAWYALYPQTRAEAARAFAREIGPSDAVVVGIRSIGTSLAAAVHATLEGEGWRVRSLTIRPRGHPFDRRVSLGPRIRVEASWVLIVDEGPGLSGSSLTATAAAFAALGVPDERIVLLPSWDPDGASFVSAAAQARWPRHRRVLGDAHRPVEQILARFGDDREDWSAGRWRERHGTWPAVQPQHERVKWVVDGCLLKFVGLGARGREVAARAERLADAGIGPPVRGLLGGFLVVDRLDGVPLVHPSPALVDAICARLQAARAMPSDRPVPVDELLVMIETNYRESGLAVPRVARSGLLGDGGTVAVDGRLAAHEWLSTATGLVKTDGVDHCDDHFFPGFQDLAWDVAGAGIELGSAVRSAVLARLGDRDLARRVPFYEVAYAAWRLGYTTLARDAVSGAERQRWDAELVRVTAAARRAAGKL